jgi:putative FmdB family regulatory protein
MLRGISITLLGCGGIVRSKGIFSSESLAAMVKYGGWNSGLTCASELLDKDAFSLMPTYEYECQKCGHHFELFQSIKDAPRKTCPKCKGRVKRLLGTGAGLIFKGSGFYITDYRKPSYTEGAKKDSGASTSPTPTAKPPATKPGEPKGPSKKD